MVPINYIMVMCSSIQYNNIMYCDWTGIQGKIVEANLKRRVLWWHSYSPFIESPLTNLSSIFYHTPVNLTRKRKVEYPYQFQRQFNNFLWSRRRIITVIIIMIPMSTTISPFVSHILYWKKSVWIVSQCKPYICVCSVCIWIVITNPFNFFFLLNEQNRNITHINFHTHLPPPPPTHL